MVNTKLIPVGIPVIDELIVGFPRDALILVIGDPGSGFLTFLHQLLVQCSNRGGLVLYTSLDRTAQEIKSDLEAFNWDLDKLGWNFFDISPSTRKKQTKTLTWDSDAVNVVSHDLFRRISSMKEKHPGESVNSIINSLTYMLVQSNTRPVLRFLNEFSALIKGTNGWHFLTMVRGVHGKETENLFSHYSDVVLEFAMTLNTETRLYERVLGIKKLLGVDSRVFPIEYDRTGIRPITTSKIQ
ncbi:MAG: hypothetical protein EAX86_11380 [Candidatus Heimdallarchaeota archaeon]|nr:hypothetical protein [Candidatus Heimdallarchaeota archaeon]